MMEMSAAKERDLIDGVAKEGTLLGGSKLRE